MSIKSLMIPNIEAHHSSEYIANVFWNQNIAQVSSITIIPCLKDKKIIQTAYINVSCWCDSEVAYNFIKRINVPEGEAKLVFNDEDWWPVHINTRENGKQLLSTLCTTFFSKNYFIKEDLVKEEDFEEFEEDEDFEITIAKSQNVTLRAHQLVYANS